MLIAGVAVGVGVVGVGAWAGGVDVCVEGIAAGGGSGGARPLPVAKVVDEVVGGVSSSAGSLPVAKVVGVVAGGGSSVVVVVVVWSLPVAKVVVVVESVLGVS